MGWSCGFSPPPHLGTVTGTAATFSHARSAFETAWRQYLPRCNVLACGAQAARHRELEITMWDAGCTLPTQTVDTCAVSAAKRLRSGRWEHIYSSHLSDVA
jgi:hypothetical protein